VNVLTPGEWNLDPGPDFIGAALRVEDVLVRGDVEVHLQPRDWIRHGHHMDPAFNQVILHVFLYPMRSPLSINTKEGMPVPGLCLEKHLPKPWASLIQNFDAEGYPYNSRCGLGDCGKKVDLTRFPFLHRLLKIAADGRILLKAERLTKERDAVKKEFYRTLFETLGYHRNKQAMALLQSLVSWDVVQELMRSETPSQRRTLMEAVLFGEAGLLPEPSGEWDGATKSYFKKIVSFWDKYKTRVDSARKAKASTGFFSFVSSARQSRQKRASDQPQPPVWTYQGVRPANFPLRRLSGLAELLVRLFEFCQRQPFENIFSEIAMGTSSSEPFQNLTVPAEGYFADRAQWGGKVFSRPAALIGPNRAQAIWVNAFLPFALSLCRERKDQKTEKTLHRLYHHLPLNEPNGTARLMAHRLLGSEKGRAFPLTKEAQQQGLLQVFQDFCDTKPWACQACVFPRVMDEPL
jgi:hypothetical protein